MTQEQEVNFQILYDDLDNQELKKVEALLHNRPQKLNFDEPHEQKFHKHYAKKFSQTMRLAMFIGISMFLATYLFDFMYVPDETMSWLIRFGIVSPILAIVIGLAYSNYYHKIQQELVLLSAIILSLGVLGITYHMPDSMQIMYINGVMLIMIYALCFSRLLFWNAVKFTVVNFISINFLLLLEPDSSLTLLIAHNYIFITGCTLLLTNNFFMEYAERQEYLQDLIINIENQQLENINGHLHQLANQDGLTGLANFRHFDNMLNAEWSRGLRYKYPVALLMLDFDHFKALNDTYGHQKGDDCLQKIACVLRSFARRPGDLAARYGGDEFVVLLVDADEKNARRIAEEIRVAILELKLPNINSPVIPYVSLSIGVATLTPDTALEPNLLFKKADDALYLSKQQGRNCVATYNELGKNSRASQTGT